MAKQESRTVSVAMCHSPAEAMMIQAMLSARGIHAIIPGSTAASFTAAATAFSSRVLVDQADAEQALALIAELRQQADEGGEALDDEGEEGSAHQREEERALEEHFDARELRQRRNRMIVASLCLSMMITLGAGHLLQRAWGRAIALIGLELVGLRYLFAGHHTVGAVLFVGAIVLDAVGSAVLASRRFAVAKRPQLPSAKLLPKGR